MRYSYILTGIFIFDCGVQRLVNNRNITKNEKLEDKIVERHNLQIEILLKIKN
jgi:hypothetical protein